MYENEKSPYGGSTGCNDMTKAKIVKFRADTKDLRKQMYVERVEKRALMHNSTPDSLVIAGIAGELFDLKNTLHEKAMAAGLPRYFHKMGHDRCFHLAIIVASWAD